MQNVIEAIHPGSKIAKIENHSIFLEGERVKILSPRISAPRTYYLAVLKTDSKSGEKRWYCTNAGVKRIILNRYTEFRDVNVINIFNEPRQCPKCEGRMFLSSEKALTVWKEQGHCFGCIKAEGAIATAD